MRKISIVLIRNKRNSAENKSDLTKICDFCRCHAQSMYSLQGLQPSNLLLPFCNTYDNLHVSFTSCSVRISVSNV